MRNGSISIAVRLIASGFLAFTSWSVRADSTVFAFDPLVRVHLARFYSGATSLRVASASPFTVSAAIGSRLPSTAGSISPGDALTVEAVSEGAGASSDGDDIALSPGQTITVTLPGDQNQTFSLQRNPASPHHYRGSLTISCTSAGALRVVDALPLEDYLKGVIGPEIGSSAPLEALKAQAIAARTYAVKNFDHNESGDADLEDTTQNQLYAGYDAETWSCRGAVDQTAGKVLTYNGELIDAPYATDCGGMTADGGEPYLKPVLDEDCAQVKPWTITIALSDLQSNLTAAGVSGLTGSIESIDDGEKDSSGRVATLTIGLTDGQGSVTVSGETLRRAVGYDKLRSTLFDVTTDSGAQTCTFTGHGWGHGLGMCQRGAIFMARSGAATYAQILLHYYTGIEITDLTSDFLQNDDDTGRDQASAGLTMHTVPLPAAGPITTSKSAPRHGS